MGNQVILASVWYIASCWVLDSGILMQVRRLVRNYLWGGIDGTRDTRVRVRRSVIILPRESGGLGIIDPKIQIRALLSKLIVRGLFPSNEPWKKYCLDAIQSTSPR